MAAAGTTARTRCRARARLSDLHPPAHVGGALLHAEEPQPARPRRAIAPPGEKPAPSSRTVSTTAPPRSRRRDPQVDPAPRPSGGRRWRAPPARSGRGPAPPAGSAGRPSARPPCGSPAPHRLPEHAAHVRLQRGDQPQLVERRRAQSPREAADALQRLAQVGRGTASSTRSCASRVLRRCAAPAAGSAAPRASAPCRRAARARSASAPPPPRSAPARPPRAAAARYSSRLSSMPIEGAPRALQLPVGERGARERGRRRSPACTRAAVSSSSFSGRSASRRMTAFTSTVAPTPASAITPTSSGVETSPASRR